MADPAAARRVAVADVIERVAVPVRAYQELAPAARLENRTWATSLVGLPPAAATSGTVPATTSPCAGLVSSAQWVCDTALRTVTAVIEEASRVEPDHASARTS